MSGTDLPFPNSSRADNGSFLGIRLTRKKKTIGIAVAVCLFLVILFNSNLNYNSLNRTDKAPSKTPSEDKFQNNSNLFEDEEDVEEDLLDVIKPKTTTTTTTKTTTTKAIIKPTTVSTQKKQKSTTLAKLVAQHYKYFIIIGSKTTQANRRQLIRSTYFGLNDNIEPCMKRDKGLGYVFYVYGDEPTPKTPERRAYETEKMEYNDLEKINTQQFNQDDVLKWANTELKAKGVTFDYLIVQDPYSIIQLNYIQQKIQAQVGVMWTVEKTAYDLAWVSSKTNGLVLLGSEVLEKVLANEKDLKQVIVTDDGQDIPLMNHYFELYRSIDVQLKMVTVPKQLERLKEQYKSLPVFMDAKDRFRVWDNVVEQIPDMTVSVAEVYQDADFISIAKTLQLGPASLCKVLDKPTIAVLSSSFIYADSCMEPSASLAADNKREYAMKHNYAFVARSNEFAQQELRSVRRRTVWGKIDAVQKVLPKYDWIFWMDMDAVIIDQEKTVQGLLDELRSSYPDGPKAFENTIDLVIAKPSRDKMINAGVFLLRNTEWAQSFLNKVQSTTEWYNRGPSYEQGAMWDIIHLPGFKEHVLLLENDDHTFNTFPKNYLPGDFIVHFAPDKCPSPAVLKGLTAAKKFQNGQSISTLDF